MIHRVKFPRARRRDKILNLIAMAFDAEDKESLVEAAKIVTDHFKMKPVRRFVWRRTPLKPRTLAAQCWRSGWIEILSPKVWKAEGRSRESWTQTILHELGHYVFWVDDEQRADDFAERIMK